MSPTWTGCWISAAAAATAVDTEHSETSTIRRSRCCDQPLSDTGGRGWLGRSAPVATTSSLATGSWWSACSAMTQFSNIKGSTTSRVPRRCVGRSSYTGQSRMIGPGPSAVASVTSSLPGLLTYFNARLHPGSLQSDQLSRFVVAACRTDRDFSAAGRTRERLVPRRRHRIRGQLSSPACSGRPKYRFSEFDNKTSANRCVRRRSAAARLAGPFVDTGKPCYSQTATTELVYRFNWGGPVVAKY